MSSSRNDFVSPVWRDGLFTDKVLFATGGNGTIVSANVKAFVALGGNACIIGRNVEKTDRVAKAIAAVRPGSKVIGIAPVDVRDAKALAAAAERCAKELGAIDFAIAGAAGNFLATMSQLSANAFKSVMDIDALGSFNTAKAVLPFLVDSARKYKNSGKTSAAGTGGRIIFISASFHFTGMPLQSHVAAAKAAVDQIAISTAIEYSPYGVTSNIICPGPIANTEGMERLAKVDEESKERMIKGVPVGRWGEVSEISNAMVFLFSEAGSFVNANNLVVDGGQWRVSGANMGGFQYPDFLLMGEPITGVKTGRESKI